MMSPQVDVVIVVGSPTSSNSNRLRELARAWAPRATWSTARRAQARVVRRQAARRPHGRRLGARGAGARGDRPRAALGAVSVRKMDGIEETIKFPLPKGLKLDDIPLRDTSLEQRHRRTGALEIESASRRLASAPLHFLRERRCGSCRRALRRRRAGRRGLAQAGAHAGQRQLQGARHDEPAAGQRHSRKRRDRGLGRQCRHCHRRRGQGAGRALPGVRARRVSPKPSAPSCARWAPKWSWSARCTPTRWRPASRARRKPAPC
jgi:hypothetical protein